ncbi:hypothetical protein OS493_016480 [Desmophyllum pertusum]|uniref:Protein JTB n=1 Tax=Desmophyllum pertusum TaxID=174260 RepID=A0A9W9ZPA3_9CNID|nr:hypothetical protein OS493_016480 [Desmophyllum pertusum]
MKSRQQKMKQWRIVAIVMSLIVLLLIANFSIQARKRSRGNDKMKTSVVIDLNATAGQKTSQNINTSSVENAKMNANSDCWKTEDTHSLADCVRCSDYEKRTIKGCFETGNIQLTYCVASNIKFYASCQHIIKWEEEKFWVFEGLVFVMLICSSFMVWYRQRQLDCVFYQKLQSKWRVTLYSSST